MASSSSVFIIHQSIQVVVSTGRCNWRQRASNSERVYFVNFITLLLLPISVHDLRASSILTSHSTLASRPSTCCNMLMSRRAHLFSFLAPVDCQITSLIIPLSRVFYCVFLLICVLLLVCAALAFIFCVYAFTFLLCIKITCLLT